MNGLSKKDKVRFLKIESSLLDFDKNCKNIPGIHDHRYRECFIYQLIDSIRRIEYVHTFYERGISPLRADPTSDLFDPLKAAALHAQKGNHDEACWLVFLATHFGKHIRKGWILTSVVYGALGNHLWDWKTSSLDSQKISDWISNNSEAILDVTGSNCFSNHRKYESLKTTPKAIKSYIDWINSNNSHRDLIRISHDKVGQNPHDVFDYLYHDMKVYRFGRLGKFDYLTMIGKLGLAPISPGKTYMTGATGPRPGAQLLFTGNTDKAIPPVKLDVWLSELGEKCDLTMQALEDALCNWQKSPEQYVLFRG